MALGAACDVGLNGPICPGLERNGGHRAVVLDEAGDNFGTPVVNAFGGVTVDQKGKRIVPGELGDLGLSVLPAIPKPSLVVIGAEADGVAADDFGIGRHEAD